MGQFLFKLIKSMSIQIISSLINKQLELIQQQQFEQGILFAQQVLKDYPNQPQVLMLLALSELHLDQMALAKEHIQAAFENGENSAYGYYIKGQIFEKLNQIEVALSDFEQAFRLEDNHTYHSRYLILKQNLSNSEKELFTVLKDYDDFILKYPNDFMGYQNRSVILKKLGLYQFALQDIEHCLKLNPNYALGWCQRALTLNLLGDLTQGFRDYEWRLKTDAEDYSPPLSHLKLWQGERLDPTEKLLIVVEQGFGDNIQFVRYALLAKQAGLNIAVLNHQGIENLLNENLHQYGIETVKNGGYCSEEITHYIPMMSLPYYFGTTLSTIPFSEPYLTAQVDYIQKWRNKIVSNKFKIGIVWAGSHKHKNNLARSLSFDTFLPLFDLPAEFHCLQKVVKNSDKQRACELSHLVFWDDEINDFSDTAGLIAQLDLIISVDTSVAHLAAAMGKTTWILIGFDPDFRWLLDRSDSPWYQSVTLFRQGADYDWNKVIQQILQDLTEKLPPVA